MDMRVKPKKTGLIPILLPLLLSVCSCAAHTEFKTNPEIGKDLTTDFHKAVIIRPDDPREAEACEHIETKAVIWGSGQQTHKLQCLQCRAYLDYEEPHYEEWLQHAIFIIGNAAYMQKRSICYCKEYIYEEYEYVFSFESISGEYTYALSSE